MSEPATSADTSSLLSTRLAELQRLSTQRSHDPAAWAAKLARRTELLNARVTTSEPQVQLLSFMAFVVGREQYGVPISEVLEVQALDHFSPLPRTPSFIAGVVQHRGELLTLFDLEALLDVPRTGLADVHFYLIVEAAGRRIAIGAKEIEGILQVPETALQPPVALSSQVPSEWTRGIHASRYVILALDEILTDERLVHWKSTH